MLNASIPLKVCIDHLVIPIFWYTKCTNYAKCDNSTISVKASIMINASIPINQQCINNAKCMNASFMQNIIINPLVVSSVWHTKCINSAKSERHQ